MKVLKKGWVKNRIVQVPAAIKVHVLNDAQLNLFTFHDTVPIYLLLYIPRTVLGLFIQVHNIVKWDLDKSTFIHAWMHVIPCLLLLGKRTPIELAIVSISVALKPMVVGLSAFTRFLLAVVVPEIHDKHMGLAIWISSFCNSSICY